MSEKIMDTCAYCKKEVEVNERKCPHCGKEFPTLGKGRSLKMLLGIFIVILILGYIFDSEYSKEVHKESYGEKWAFTTGSVILKCFKDNDIVSPVVEIEGKNFGLTGFADNKYGQGDINALNVYWLDNTENKGMKQDLGIFMKEAKELCD